MEILKENKLLKFHPNTLQVVRKIYNLEKPGQMAEAVDILDAWVKQQNHFQRTDFDRDYLERIIITTKGSVERAKARIDRICTFRTLLPELFNDFDSQNYHKNLEILPTTILPDLTEDYSRVIFVKHNDGYIDLNLYENWYKYIFMIAEYLTTHDYVNGIIIVADYGQTNLAEVLLKANPILVHKWITILTQGYGMRLKGIHLISDSRLIQGIIAILKRVLSEKVFKRVTAHKSIESVYDHIPKDFFPADYGGKAKPLSDLSQELVEILCSDEHRAHCRETKKAATDESKRLDNKYNDRYLGLPGTFRSLHVD